MNNADKIRNWLITTLSRQYDPAFGQHGLEHAVAVGQLAGFLALKYHLNVSNARIAGYLHDIAFYTTHYHPEHAHRSAEMAKKILSENTDLDVHAIEEIIRAIDKHSDKSKTDDLFCEILKDADVISHAVADGWQSLNDDEVRRLKKYITKE